MKKRIKIILFSIVLVLVAITMHFLRNYPLACDVYAETGINGIIASEINKKISNKLNNNIDEYSQIATINTNSDGSISTITIKSSIINNIALGLSADIYNTISESNYQFGIPFGNVMGYELLSGKGPKINIKIKPISATKHEIKSELLSSGINQSLHRILVLFTTEIMCLAPFHKHKSFIETELILFETLIVGKVPEVIIQR